LDQRGRDERLIRSDEMHNQADLSRREDRGMAALL
jgi:hypothetical protein